MMTCVNLQQQKPYNSLGTSTTPIQGTPDQYLLFDDANDSRRFGNYTRVTMSQTNLYPPLTNIFSNKPQIKKILNSKDPFLKEIINGNLEINNKFLKLKKILHILEDNTKHIAPFTSSPKRKHLCHNYFWL